jgi:CheY-like chemotaxis protein
MISPRQTILVIEDDQNDVIFLQQLLKSTNLTKPLQVVTTGECALEYLKGEGKYRNRKLFPLPALVFLDLKLPGMSGFEVLTWIRQQPRLQKLMVTVLTGSPLTIDIYRAYELGANAYLVKPLKLHSLDEMIKTLELRWLSIHRKHKLGTRSSTSRPLAGVLPAFEHPSKVRRAER